MFLTKAQSEIAKDLHRFRVLRCGRRFGKTHLAVEEIKGKVLSKPRNVTYFATTYQQARDIAWGLLKKQLQPVIVNINDSRLEMRIKVINSNELSLLQLRGWEAVEAERGKQNDFIVIDEVASMRNFWTGWKEVLRPTLTDTQGEALFASTPKGYNHFYDLCNLELVDNDYKTFPFTTYDNPHIPVEEIEKAKRELSNEQFLQEYMASFEKTAGLVYKEFNREKHIYYELPEEAKSYEKIAGIDFGYIHPAVVLTILTDGEKFFIEDEWVKTGRTEIQLAEYVQACKFQEVYPDPENPSAIEELRRKGINVREVIKGKDSIISGIQKVRELLISGKLKVNARNVNTIAGFEMYSHDEDNLTEKPLKENDDEMDALRYLVTMKMATKPDKRDLIDLEIMRRERKIEQQEDAGL